MGAQAIRDRSLPHTVRVLFLSPVAPWPLHSGGHLRTYHLLSELAGRDFEVEFMCVGDDRQGPQAAKFISPIVHTFHAFPRSPAPISTRLTQPAPVKWFYSADLRCGVEKRLTEAQFDLIHLDELLMLDSLPQDVQEPIVVHHHKLDWEWARATGAPARQCRAWRRLERRACQLTPHHIVCAREDADRLHKRHSNIKAVAIPCGTRTCDSSPATRQARVGRFLFLGSLDYEPNVRALEALVPLFTAARRTQPALELQIVGARPTERVHQLQGEGVSLFSNVPDIRPYLAQASALLAPLGIAGGSRIKICDALAAGCPVVASSAAAEGLELIPGAHFMLANCQADLRTAIEQLCTPQGLQNAELQALSGRAQVCKHHDWAGLANQLQAQWESTSLESVS